MVTGATDGIGLCYARALAKRGINVVLISRSEIKLRSVKADIEDQFGGVKVKIVQVDFGHDDDDSYTDRITSAVAALKICVVVNNVGAMGTEFDVLHRLEPSKVDYLVRCNIESLNKVASIGLAKMVNNPDQVNTLFNIHKCVLLCNNL